ncbi:MAG: hypothetical protein AAGA42_16860 [Actinomycetota bacterium]
MANPTSITVSKVANDEFRVKFDGNVNFGSPDNGTVPVEWLRGVLDYYISARGHDGAVDGAGNHPDW